MKKSLFLLFVIASTACAQDKTYEVGQIKTAMGEILVWLYDEAPKHKKAFIELANEGYWDDYTFNRVIENFVAQGGCPDTPEGFAYSVHLLEPEFEAGKKPKFYPVEKTRCDCLQFEMILDAWSLVKRPNFTL